jgi:HEAT repeat protein
MTRKNGDNELSSKRILELLTYVTAVGGALATIIGVFFPSDEAKRVAFAMAILLAISSGAVFYWQRRRAARMRISEPFEPLAPSAALRGLLPFEEGDTLPGRGRDVQDIYTLVASSSFRFGVLWGESGCGKTSLLRAGLVPTLRKNGFLPLYIPKPTKDPQDAIRAALKKEAADSPEDQDLKKLLRATAPKGKNVVILFDQFEEFFLTNRTLRSRASFVKWLGDAVSDASLPVEFLISIRGDFFVQLQNLAPNIPEPTSPRTTYQLRNFDSEQAKQIFNAAAKADAIPFESALIDAVVNDLETEGVVRPAELQVVGTRLKRRNIFNLNKYEVVGRARGVLSSYISDEIKQSANEQAARLVLRLMTADAVDTKSPTDLTLDDIIRGIGGVSVQVDGSPTRSDEIQNILNQFVAARIVIHTDDDKYNLVHDYLAPYVRTATEGAKTNVERANQLLKRYLADYKEDAKTRIPFRRLREIQKHATAEVKGGEKARELMSKSVRAFYAAVGGALVAVLIPILALYIFLANSYYLSTEPAAYEGGSPVIVIRSGNPYLRFVPGFNNDVIQTDFTVDDLVPDPKARDEILREQVTGFWFEQADGGYEKWGEQLVMRLPPLSQARALRWLSRPNRAAEVLIPLISDPKADSSLRSDAVSALGELERANPNAVTSDMIQSLLAIVSDPKADSSLRSNAASALGQLGQTNPQVVTPAVLQAIMAIVTDPKADSSLRYDAVSALRQFGQANPQAVTPAMLQAVIVIVTDPKADLFLRAGAVSALGQFGQANPRVVTPAMLQAVIDIVTDPKADSSLRSDVASALGQLGQSNPNAVTPNMIQSLLAVVNDPNAGYNATSALGQLGQANPNAVTSNMIQALLAIVSDPKADWALRDNAVSALGQLGQANPQVVTPAMLQAVMDIVTDPKADSNLRYGAVSALGQLGQANPQVMTPQVIQSLLATLLAIVSDPKADSRLRYDAVSLVGRLGQANPNTVTTEQIQSLLAVVSDPKADSNLRYEAVSLLGQLGQANPNAMTSNMIQSLLAIVSDTKADSILRDGAVSALGQLGQANPQVVTPAMLQTVIDIVTDPHAYSTSIHFSNDALLSALNSLSSLAPDSVLSRTNDLYKISESSGKADVMKALGRAYFASALKSNPSDRSVALFALLKEDRDSNARIIGAYALCLFAVDDPRQEPFIRDELNKLSASDQPHLRIAASKTLEMLAVGDLVQKVRDDSEQLTRIKSQLNTLNCSWCGEEHIKFAASVALEEIAKIEKGKK